MSIIGSVFPESGGPQRQYLLDFGFKDCDAGSLYHLNRFILLEGTKLHTILVYFFFFIKSIKIPIPGVMFSTVGEQK